VLQKFKNGEQKINVSVSKSEIESKISNQQQHKQKKEK